jgi:hypothetical protein
LQMVKGVFDDICANQLLATSSTSETSTGQD